MKIAIVADGQSQSERDSSRDPAACAEILRALGQQVTLLGTLSGADPTGLAGDSAFPPRLASRPDVVLSIGAASPVAAAIIAESEGVPLVLTLPVELFPPFQSAPGYRRLLCRHLPTACYLVESDRLRREAEQAGSDPHKIFVVPPGVDMDQWSPRPTPERRTLSVLFDASRSSLAAHLFLENVLARLRKERGRTLHTVVLTDPHNDDPGADAVAEVWARSCQAVLESLPDQARLVELYGASDVVVVPGHTTDETIAAVRAQAAGRSLLAADCPQIQDVVSAARHGVLAEPGDTDEWLDKLEYLSDEPSLRVHLGKSARLNAKTAFSLAQTGRRIAEHLRAVTALWHYVRSE